MEVSIRLRGGEVPRDRSSREMSPDEAPARAPRKQNATWTHDDDQLLIRLLSRPPISWDTISRELEAHRLDGGEKTPSACQTRLKRFKMQFRVVSALKQAPGLSYDNEFGCTDADERAWTKYVKLHPEAAHFRDKGLPFYGEIKTMLNKIAVERTPQPGPNTLRTAGQTTGGDVTDEGDGSEEHDPPNVSGDDADALKNYSEDRSGSDNDRRSHTRQRTPPASMGPLQHKQHHCYQQRQRVATPRNNPSPSPDSSSSLDGSDSSDESDSVHHSQGKRKRKSNDARGDLTRKKGRVGQSEMDRIMGVLAEKFKILHDQLRLNNTLRARALLAGTPGQLNGSSISAGGTLATQRMQQAIALLTEETELEEDEVARAVDLFDDQKAADKYITLHMTFPQSTRVRWIRNQLSQNGPPSQGIAPCR